MCYTLQIQTQSMTMIRSTSPAMSEISVGSPSPPLQRAIAKHSSSHDFPFVPIINRLKPATEFPAPLAQNQRSSNERVKSFSIADILGKHDESSKATKSTDCVQPPAPSVTSPILSVPPLLPSIPASHTQIPVVAAGPLLMLDLPTLHKVLPAYGDPAHLGIVPNTPSPTLSMHPFFPPALLQYEQRLAWDYQRQLQEHFQAQAQLLRQMSMDPNIIPSEDGSERGGSCNSSAGGSHCASPEVRVESEDDEEDDLETESCAEGRTERSASDSRSVRAKSVKPANDTPLDALFQLSTKNFDEDQDPATLNIFATRPNPKKKRKSRTAFTNHQIFELEKRFLYQKYLSPADRDEIAAGLGLSNAQVITWFQNRRAKLKRDMEELKKDVESVKQLSAHKSFLENVNDLSILKTRPVSRHHPTTTTSVMPQPAHAEVIHTSAITHGIPGTSTGATAAAAAGRPPSLQHPQPTTVQQPLRHSQHQIPPRASTRDTCAETRESQQHIITVPGALNNSTKVNSSLRRSHSESSESHPNNGPQQPAHSQHIQQPARNLQISTSRG